MIQLLIVSLGQANWDGASSISHSRSGVDGATDQKNVT